MAPRREEFQSFNRIIVTANPSFGTTKEADFWKHFDRVCEREGWRLFKHSMRKIPEDDRTMILPARLADVAGFLRFGPEGEPSATLPPWFTKKNFETIVDWEHRRWQLAEPEPKVPVGLCRLAWHVDGIFHRLRPAGVIVSNKIDHGTALFYWAALYYGSQTIFFERSPLESFIAEEKGMFRESEVWSRYPVEVKADRPFFEEVGRSIAGFLAANTDGFRKQEFADASEARSLLAGLPKPLLFLPMDNVLWTGWAQKGHWQGAIDHFKNTPEPSEAVNALAEIAARLGGSLVVKKHPSDVQPYKVDRPNVRFLDAPLDYLIGNSDVTVTFLTKVAFVSAAMRKPTVVLAPNTVAAGPACILAESSSEWAAAIERALKLSAKESESMWQELCALLGWLDRRFYIDSTVPADLSKPSALAVLSRISASRAGLKAALSISAADALVASVRGAFSARKTWMARPAEAPQKIKLVYDVTRLANTRLHHSGISRFVSNTLALLRKNGDVEVVPFVSKPQILNRGEFKGDFEAFSASLGGGVAKVEDIERLLKPESAVYFSPYEDLVDLGGLNLPRIATVHDVLHITSSEWYLDPKLRVHIDAVLRSIGEKDHVLTVSEFTRMQLLRVHGLDPFRVQTVHLAAGHAFARQADADVRGFEARHGLSGSAYFVLFGQFEFRKNVATTLSAVRSYMRSNPDGARFVIVGSAVGTEGMRNAVLQAGIDLSRTVFLEGPTDAELALAYSGATAMLYVSLAEGFGLPICEALACGCAVVTSSVTSIPEVVGDAALYVDPYDAAQIETAMSTLAESKSLVAQLRRAALKKSREFSWSKTADGIVRLARDAVAAGPSACTNDGRLADRSGNYEYLSAYARSLEERLSAGADHRASLLDPESTVLHMASWLLCDAAVTRERLSKDVSLQREVEAARAALGEEHRAVRHLVAVTKRVLG